MVRNTWRMNYWLQKRNWKDNQKSDTTISGAISTPTSEKYTLAGASTQFRKPVGNSFLSG